MIRWITDSLGTAAYNDAVHDDITFQIVDVRDLVDKRGNNTDVIRKKIDETLDILKQGKKAVICCDYGISRSNSIAAGVLSQLEGIPFSDAVQRIISTTGEKKIKIQMLSAVRKVIDTEEFQHPTNRSKDTIMIVGTGIFGNFLKKLLPVHLKDTAIISRSEKKMGLLQGIETLDAQVKENDVGYIIHLAEPEMFSDNESMGISITLLKNCIDVCCDNEITLVYPSNSEIYSGYQSVYLRASECLQPNPKSIYGQTKMLCENLIAYSERNDRLRSMILRYSTIYGNSRPKFIYNFINLAKRDKEINTHMYRNGFPTVDLLHINDAVFACAAALKADRPGIFNIGSGTGLTTFEIAQKIIEQSGSNSKIGHINIDEYASNVVLDSSYAKKALDWVPTVDFDDELKLIISKSNKEIS
jgi:UDP-glucuronate decarboxylase